MTAEHNGTKPFESKIHHNNRQEISPWTWVTICRIAETYPVEFRFNPDKKKFVKEPLPFAVTEVHDVKIPFLILQLLGKIGLRMKYVPPGREKPQFN